MLRPTLNQILAALPRDELQALLLRLEHAPLPYGRTLCEPGEPLKYLYFPTDGLITSLHVHESGAVTEVATVGREGMVSVALLLGEEIGTTRAVVVEAGHAYRLSAAHARALFAQGGEFQRLALRCAGGLLVALTQTAVCNQRHSLEQQLCRWLLMRLDRLQADEIHLTQELIAQLLGVRRQGVAEAAKRLEKRGIIRCSRGSIRILDRHALEQRACECYAVVARHAAPDLVGRKRGQEPFIGS